MRFIRQGVDQAVEQMARVISAALDRGHAVLWLVSGGSNITPECRAMQRIVEGSARTERLTVIAVDERFSPAGHADSNFAQMQTAGFRPGSASWIDVLAHNESFEETVAQYDTGLSELLGQSDVVVATLGMGADGHTAGILPGSPAIAETPAAVVGYHWGDYDRMTSTCRTLRRIDHAWLLAYGENKHDALQRLADNTDTLDKLPSKILYELRDVRIYNDVIESEG